MAIGKYIEYNRAQIRRMFIIDNASVCPNAQCKLENMVPMFVATLTLYGLTRCIDCNYGKIPYWTIFSLFS